MPQNVYKRFKSLQNNEIVDVEAINVLNENDNAESEKTIVNEQLKKAILEGMPESLSTLEKAIYIYIKMCKILSYDDEFFAQNQKNKYLTRDHKNIEYISSITPDNPKIVCYEFNAIYAKLLEELGINCLIGRSILANYGEGHANLKFRVGKYLIDADSTYSILTGDMIRAKLGEELRGIVCENINKDTQNEFNNALNKVYALVNKSDNNRGLEEILNEYKKIKEEEGQKETISIEKKLDILTSIIDNLKVNDMDKIAFAIYLLDKIFTEEERKKYIHAKIIKTTNAGKTNKYASSTIIFTIMKDQNNYKYYEYLPGYYLIERNEHYLDLFFKNGILDYIKKDDENKIPNIKGGRIR